MYESADYLALVALAASGQLALDAVRVETFAFSELEGAIDAAGRMDGLACTVALVGADGM